MTTTDVASALIGARALIEREEDWCRSDYAQDAEGHPAAALSDAAVRFNAPGAIGRITGYGYGYRDARVALSRAMGHVPTALFNSTHTHAEVLAAFDRAIEEAKGEK